MLTTNTPLNHQTLIKPNELIKQFEVSTNRLQFIHNARTTAINIIQGHDPRLLVIIGPCSIHDINAALDYAERLKNAAQFFCDDLVIMMRTYFQKPRTTLGWKGLINDPYLDGSHDVNHGLCLARHLLVKLSEMSLPAATEFVDPMIHHYFSDLISWSAIGARTVESQLHRELASSLPMPVGFKNNTDGNIKVAIEAVKVAREKHHFINVNSYGNLEFIETQGNPNCHVILRGANHCTNYSSEHVHHSVDLLKAMRLTPRIMIDCSHGNSMKDYLRQHDVIQDIALQIAHGSHAIHGVMLESHLIAGKQNDYHKNKLVYGQSITDGCLGWEESFKLLEILALAVRKCNLLKN